jgi:hypothetical protein
MTFRYPQHPNSDRVDPFRDEDGRNPFADADPGDPSPTSNVYQASADGQPASYRPVEHVTSQRARGRPLLLLASLGFVATTLAACGIIAARFVSFDAFGGMLSAMAGPLLLGAAASWSAWMLAGYDLRAMRVGAMQREMEQKTRRAYWMGAVGSLLAIVPVVILITSFIRAVIQAF